MIELYKACLAELLKVNASNDLVECATCHCVMAVPYAGHSDVHFCSDQCDENYEGQGNAHYMTEFDV